MLAALLGVVIHVLGAGACSRKEAEKFPPLPPCVAPEGTPVEFKATLERQDDRVYGVASSPAELLKIYPRADPASYDFARYRYARVSSGHGGAKVPWVVETHDEVIVGMSSYPYCSGASPHDTELDIVLPASKKPVRYVQCSGGECPPGPPQP